MRTVTLSVLLILTATAFAGCADTSDPAPGTGTTPATGTPAGTTPAGTTPVTGTPSNGTTPGNGTAAPSEITYVAKQSAPPGPNATNITYSFEGPATARDGWVTVHLENKGFELHQVALWNLGNLSYEAFVQSLASPPNATNGTMGPQRVGGVGAAGPGANVTAIVHLTPGTYAAICFIPGPSGMPHAVHGMIKKLTVVKGPGAGAAEPVANATLTLDDYKFNLSKNLTAGRHVVKVVNEGVSNHEAPLVKLAGNATAQDFLDYFAPGHVPMGPPPVEGGWGAAPIAPGGVQYIVVELRAGHYAFLCFEQDHAQSPPHFALGMVHEFDVK